MTTELQNFSTTPASNSSASPDGAPEGMAPSGVNNTIREIMAQIAKERDDIQGVVTTGGSGNAQTIAAVRTTATAYEGEMFLCQAGATNTGAATINITPAGGSARGTVAIQRNGAALVGGEITSGGIFLIVYDGTQYQLLGSPVANPLPVTEGGTGVQTLTDGGVLLGSGTADITAMGVLSDGQMIVGDGSTDPVAESGATLRTSVGVGTGDSPQFTGLTMSGALIKSVTNSITAGSTQSQAGATALTTDINRVTVSGTDGDGVKLPTAVAGAKVEIINDDAAQTIQIWPATGDAIDGGSANAVDANTLAPGGDRTYFSVDATNWYTKSSDEPAASATVAGIVELATTAETTTGTDAARAVTPDGLHDMTSLSGAAWLLDEDAMGSNSDVKVASQQSIKAYVDALGVTSSGSPTFTGLTTTGHTQRSLATSLTAGTTQTMAGALALTKDINIVTVVGSDDDGVALPTAVAGKEVTIINSDAAQRLQVWPGNGFSDTIDGGSANAVDANTLAAGGIRTYVADGSTNWVTATAEGSAFDPDGAVTINNSGASVDFIVKSDAANAIFVDGSQDAISFGGANVDGTALTFNNLTKRTAITNVGFQAHMPNQTTNFDTGSSTIGGGYGMRIGVQTWTNDNATLTITNPAGLQVHAPVASTNVAFTNGPYAIFAAAKSRMSGGVEITSGSVLDNYTEGSWTPTLHFHTTAGSHTYGAQSGYFVQIGQLVVASFQVVLTNLDTCSGIMGISDIPRAVLAHTDMGWSGFLGYYDNITANTNKDHLVMVAGPSDSQFRLYENGIGATASITDADAANDTRLSGVLVYMTAVNT